MRPESPRACIDSGGPALLASHGIIPTLLRIRFITLEIDKKIAAVIVVRWRVGISGHSPEESGLDKAGDALWTTREWLRISANNYFRFAGGGGIYPHSSPVEW